MTKGGNRCANKDQDGKWFAHVGSKQCEVKRETCTTTGVMLSQATPQHMRGQERYPKTFINNEKKKMGRSYPFSTHDNRETLHDSIATYAYGLGRKKCNDDRRQHNSHFCLCHDGPVSSVWPESSNSVFQTDFQPMHTTESTNGTRHLRRFSRNHREKSLQAVAAQAEEGYMWFGRHNMNYRTPLSVLAVSNLSSPS